jgi:hypothetical protein
MIGAWRGFTAKLRRLWQLLVLFCVLRIVAGVAVIVLFDRDAVAWGWELTGIVCATLVVYVSVALAVRWWAPPRRA